MTISLFGGAEGRTDDQATLAALEVDYTPPAVAVQAVLSLRAELDDMGVVWSPRRALDPAAGSGVWGRAMRAVLGPDVHLVGVEPRSSEAENLFNAYNLPLRRTFDGACKLLGASRPFDLVATNPPFSAFEPGDFWPLALRRADLLHEGSVVALLGLSSWGQGEGAAATLRAWSPSLQLRLGGRAAFRGGGQTDAREYSLWVWSGHAYWQTGPRPAWRVVQLPVLPTAMRRWSTTCVPGTQPIDPALVDEIRGRYL